MRFFVLIPGIMNKAVLFRITLVIFSLGSFSSSVADVAVSPQSKPREVVASYNPLAREAALAILAKGGNAFDAFIAATMVEYVVAPGVTSMAGPLVALTYHKDSNTKLVLDAEMNHPQNPEGMWKEGQPSGKGVMVPGAIAGLDAIHKKYGTLAWSELIHPALKIARDGFEISEAYSTIVSYRQELLTKSAYGQKMFFRDGKPLNPQALLKQPEVALLLDRVSKSGAREMYHGKWAADFIDRVRDTGGMISKSDLEQYQPVWRKPLETSYRGYTVYGCSGRSLGGAWSLTALKAIERHSFDTTKHYSKSANDLEAMVRTAQWVWQQGWIVDPSILDLTDKGNLLATSSAEVWEQVQSSLTAQPPAQRGSHSYHVIVVDRFGNAVTGTNSINSLPWGDGEFVDGVPLTNYVAYLGGATKPGERRMSPMSSHLVFDNDKLRVVSGTFNSSLVEAGFQMIVNALDFKLSAHEAAHLPRFGTFSFSDDLTSKVRGKNWLDPQVSREVVTTLKQRGLEFEQSGYIDTGSGAIVKIHPDGSVEAGMPPLGGHDNNPSYR